MSDAARSFRIRWANILIPLIVIAVSATPASAATPPAGPSYLGTPPLTSHGGRVLDRVQSTTGATIVTPIFWSPAGYSFDPQYKSIILRYLADVAADSGKSTNVFSVLAEYPDSTGPARYAMQVTRPVIDTRPFPASGCTVDEGSIYNDRSGYSACLASSQLASEAIQLQTTRGDGTDRLLVMFLPKGVESCSNYTSTRACTLNHGPTSRYCADHYAFEMSRGNNLPGVYAYATMPFPIYRGGVGTCTKTDLLGTQGIQSPNGNVDADVEIGLLSSEMSSAITNPTLDGWYDSSGHQVGDECAYVYGALSGTDGAYYNQTINGSHYLTQEEFSNARFNAGKEPCIQGEDLGMTTPPTTPATVSPDHGPPRGGNTVTITGEGFDGRSGVTVNFGSTSASSFTVDSPTQITAIAPQHTAGVVNIRVITNSSPRRIYSVPYRYGEAPTITSVAPVAGPAAGGNAVTIQGTNLIGTREVRFSAAPATRFTVDSPTQITAIAPQHEAGVVTIRLTTPNGTTTDIAGRYTYHARPAVAVVAPNSGPASGGESVTIRGSGFTDAAGVTFGGTHASITSASPNRISVTTPARRPGRVNVRVTTAYGTSPAGSSGYYTFE